MFQHCSLDEELVGEEELPRCPYLKHLFPTGVPHLKYQRLVIVADENQIGELCPKEGRGMDYFNGHCFQSTVHQ